MLTINVSPIRSDKENPSVSWSAPVLTVGNDSYDLSMLPQGAAAYHKVIGDVLRVDGGYSVGISYNHKQNASELVRYPKALVISENGAVNIEQLLNRGGK